MINDVLLKSTILGVGIQYIDFIFFLFHFDLLSGTNTVARNLVQLLELLHGCSVASSNLRECISALDGYALASCVLALALLAAAVA